MRLGVWTGRCRTCQLRHLAKTNAVGRFLDRHGYVHLTAVSIPDEHRHLFEAMANRAGSVLEHRFVMACHIGRPLWPDEVVHHLNGIRADNTAQNLELLTTKREHHPAHGDVYYQRWQQAELEIQRLRERSNG